MKTLFRALSICPLWLLHALGWVLGWAAFVGSRTYRQRFLANAQQAGYGFADVSGAVGESGKLIAELPRLWLGAPVPIVWDGSELIDAALARGQGIVFMTPHLGCFEVTAQGYARLYGAAGRSNDGATGRSNDGATGRSNDGDAGRANDSATGQSITVLYRPARKAWLRALVDTARLRPGLLAAPTTLAGVKQLLAALKNRQAVGLLPDQVPPAGLGVWADFFGRPAYTMTLGARLAQQPAALVLIAWGERLAWGAGYCIHLSELQAPLPSDAHAAAAQVNAEMAHVIRQRPGQYLWGYARYKSPNAALARDGA